MKTLVRIGSLFMILVLLYGTAGMTVLHHVCNSSRTDEVTLYPGILEDKGSSCCGEEMGMTRPVLPGNEKSTGNSCVDEPPCCTSILKYYKLDITQVRISEPVVTAISVAEIPSPVASATAPARTTHPMHSGFFRFKSPPLSGKALVIFLHQVRIPAPSSLS